MIDIYEAIFALNPNIVIIRSETAYDKDENVVAYDLAAAEAKLTEMQAEAAAAAQAAIDAKQSALNKLMALGLTEEEALALGVK
jgi:hypothetical protein